MPHVDIAHSCAQGESYTRANGKFPRSSAELPGACACGFHACPACAVRIEAARAYAHRRAAYAKPKAAPIAFVGVPHARPAPAASLAGLSDMVAW